MKITEEYDLEHEMAEDDCLLQRHSIDRLIQVHMVWYTQDFECVIVIHVYCTSMSKMEVELFMFM